ncbi:MAG: hypothetical protein CM1200mP2_28150 [Planctomycetaceae bacterium]|nr:MAG: hypothetical protein CM1200mP2_28150 [Planctomycetaceae bacterium]
MVSSPVARWDRVAADFVSSPGGKGILVSDLFDFPAQHRDRQGHLHRQSPRRVPAFKPRDSSGSFLIVYGAQAGFSRSSSPVLPSRGHVIRWKAAYRFRGRVEISTGNLSPVRATACGSSSSAVMTKPPKDKVNLVDKLQQFTEHWSPRIVGELNGQHVKLPSSKASSPGTTTSMRTNSF